MPDYERCQCWDAGSRNSTVAGREGVAINPHPKGEMVANLSLLTQLVADEALEAELATEAALTYLRHALSDGVFTPDEAQQAIEKLEAALREAREAKVASDFAYSRHRAAETIMREDADCIAQILSGNIKWKRHRLEVLRDAGLKPVEMPANVIDFPTPVVNTDDAA